MRFCPFCSAENVDESTHCTSCARRLPPLPPRRRKSTRSQPVLAPPAQEPTVAQPDQLPAARAALNPHPAGKRSAPPPPSRAGRDALASAAALEAREQPREQPRELPREERRELPHEIDDEWPAPERRASPPREPIDHQDGWSEDAETVLRDPSLAPASRLESSGPPPTRVVGSESTRLKLQHLEPVPEVPESGLVNSVRYALSFAMARWKRRKIIKELNAEIQRETTALDGVLGTLGRQARSLEIENAVLEDENRAIDAAEARRERCEYECSELSARRAEENSKFAEVESDRQAKVDDAEAALAAAQRELGSLDAQRRGLREKRKGIERQQKGYLKAAEDREAQAGKSQMGDARAALRRAADELRRDAAKLDPERQDIERRLGALEKPIARAMAKAEAIKAEVEAARRSLNDAREGHRHRLAEIDAEQSRKTRELAQADAEIQRRLVTLGTLVNLHRSDVKSRRGALSQYAQLTELFEQIDTLRAAIGGRSTEIDRLTAEREAYDRKSLVNGFVVLGAGALTFITLLVILLWVAG